MAADLALATDPQIVERSADPAAFVVQACQRAKAWLTEALEYGQIEQIAEIKSQAEAVRVYTAQKQLGWRSAAASRTGRSPGGGIAAAAARPACTAETRVIGVATTWVPPPGFSGTETSAPAPTR